METLTKVNGKLVRETVKEYKLYQIAHTKVNLEMVNQMVKKNNLIQMETH